MDWQCSWCPVENQIFIVEFTYWETTSQCRHCISNSRIIKTIPVTVRLNWIKSHQDADKTAKKLTVEAQMKIKADVMASNFLERCPSVAKGGPRNNSSHFPTMQVSLIINNQRIHTSTAERMRQSIKLRNYNIYFVGKHGNSKATLADWENLA